MRLVRANGLVIHYLIEGPEALPPIVFVNPLGCDLRVWSEVASILKPEFRVLCYDKRGHGLSESGPDRCEMADYARDLAALLDAVEIRRAAIVGISIGGVIAQELTRQRPELAAALILCDTAGEGRHRPILGRAHRRGRTRRRRGGRRPDPRALVHGRVSRGTRGGVRRLSRDADANAAARLSRRLRRPEARRPSPSSGPNRDADPVPGRRPGRHDPAGAGQGNVGAHWRLALRNH